jgi:hypothetical protein
MTSSPCTRLRAALAMTTVQRRSRTIAAYRVEHVMAVEAVEGVYERQGGGWAVRLGQYDRAVQCDDRGGCQGDQVVVQGKGVHAGDHVSVAGQVLGDRRVVGGSQTETGGENQHRVRGSAGDGRVSHCERMDVGRHGMGQRVEPAAIAECFGPTR